MASAVVLFLLPASGRAYAQSGGASPVTVQWDNGLTVAAGGGASELQLGGLIQADGRFAPGDPLHQVQDELVMRRVRLIAQGRIAKEIATALNISVRTAEFHRVSIMQRLGLRTTAELTRFALENGIAE